jgi:hypothetical protein
MPTLSQARAGLEALRASLVQPYHEAKARNDLAEMSRLTALAGEIDDALDDLGIADLQALAPKLAELRARVDAATTKAKAWPFGSSDGPSDRERLLGGALPDNDAGTGPR